MVQNERRGRVMNAPTVIIGLGGIGSEIVSMVERQAKDLGCDITNIKFVLIDTDISALNNRKKSGFTGTTIRISSNITVERCKELNEDADKWYPDNRVFSNKTLTDGAGQVRAISRLALEHAILQEMLEPLWDNIIELHQTHRNMECKTMRIAVVSSLAGGTGSGLVLPFAVYLADRLKKDFNDNGYNMNGFFVMPDIVLKGNKGNRIEEISLNSNAYATIKELDNFTQRNAGTISMDAELTLPRIRKDNNILYNFVFLFGLFNDDGNYSSLYSQQEYKRMIADCVYLPYCSPIHEKNISWEDNKFKHLAIMLTMEEKNKRYRHFGSIGVATMEYPYKLIRSYLTMTWAQDMMQGRWFYYDEQYEKELGEYKQLQKEGLLSAPFMKRGEFYRHLIERKNCSFSEEIIQSLTVKENAMHESMAWEIYLENVENHIVSELKTIIEKEYLAINTANKMFFRSLDKGRSKKILLGNKFAMRYWQMNDIAGKIIRIQKNIMSTEIFYNHDNSKEYVLEKWILQDRKGNPILPNAARYFLEKVYESIDKRIIDLKEEVNNTHFRLDSKLQNLNEADSYSIKKKKLKEELEEAPIFFENMIRGEVMLHCLNEGQKRVKSLLAAYEELFNEYRIGMEQLEYNKNLKENEIVAKYGIRVEKICSSKEYLMEFHKKMQKESSLYYGALDKVSGQIYEIANRIAQGEETSTKKKNQWDTLLKKWEQNFDESYGEMFDMDIISALEWQTRREVKKENPNNEVDDNVVKSKMKEKIKCCGMQLAAPFMSTSLDSNKTIIRENYFHSSLLELRGIKGEVVKESLIEESGVWDEEVINKYKIHFYQSLFGVHARYLLPFGKYGDCSKDYERITRFMHLNGYDGQILTPHIDKSWHREDILPEIDADIQEERLKQEWVALIYGIIAAKHIIKNDVYCFENMELKHVCCNNIWEVMEVIRTYHEEKNLILNDMEKMFQEESYKRYDETEFYRLYQKTNIIEDIYIGYALSMPEKRFRSEKFAELFVDAWKEILMHFWKGHGNYDKANFEKLMKEKIEQYEKSRKQEEKLNREIQAEQKLEVVLIANGLQIETIDEV